MPRAKPAPSAPAPKPFEGFKLALSGKFNTLGYTQSALEVLVKGLGGTVGSRVDANTTHLVCTDDDFEAKSTKVTTAQDKDVPILKIDWLLKCDADKKLYDVDDYLLSSQPKNGANSATDSKANGSVALRGKKRKADDPAASSQKVPQKKKATAADDDDDDDDAKDDKVEEEETKKVAEGQFIKKKDAVIPLDEHCPEQDRTVHVDPDTGMIYDASLNQSNSSHNNNKFYRVQVQRNFSPSLIVTRLTGYACSARLLKQEEGLRHVDKMGSRW